MDDKIKYLRGVVRRMMEAAFRLGKMDVYKDLDTIGYADVVSSVSMMKAGKERHLHELAYRNEFIKASGYFDRFCKYLDTERKECRDGDNYRQVYAIYDGAKARIEIKVGEDRLELIRYLNYLPYPGERMRITDSIFGTKDILVKECIYPLPIDNPDVDVIIVLDNVAAD